MNKFKKYYLAILAILALILDLVSTYYCSGESLKYEGNPLYLKYKFGWIGLIFVLSFFCFLDIILYLYHKYFHEKYKLALMKNQNIQNSENYIFSYIKKCQSFVGVINVFEIIVFSILNFAGFYRIRIYIFAHIPLIINNFLLGIIYNNATLKIDEKGKSTNIYINDNWIWDTFLGDLAISYFSLGQEGNQKILNNFHLIASIIIVVYFLYQKSVLTYIVDNLSTKNIYFKSAKR